MARPLRIDVPDGFYHVMARGIERRVIFPSETSRVRWVENLAELPERFGVRVHAWVLMPNHFHLQLETPEANLSAAVQWLNVSFAVWFNRKYQRTGPLFQGRFKAQLTETERWVAEVNRYLHLNPVRISGLELDKRSQAETQAKAPGKELVRERLRELREYRWSSCRAYLGLERAPEWLTVKAVRAQFGGGHEKEQIAHYRKSLEEAVREGRREAPWEGAAGGVLVGSAKFVERMRKRLGVPNREVPGSRILERRLTFEQWCARMESLRGESWECVAEKHGDPGRDLVLLAARKYGRLSLKEIGKKVSLDYGTVASSLHRIRSRIAADRRVEKLWIQLIKC